MAGSDPEANNSKMKNAPIIFVRSHEMNWGTIYNQKVYGEGACELTEEYGGNQSYVADLYRSGFDGNYRYCYRNYIFDDNDGDYGRGIHPNGRGLAKFYLPQIEEQMMNMG